MGKIRILVVEDEAINMMSITRALRNYGYHICTPASTGEEAVQIAIDEKPDVILMDIHLSGRYDGFETCREIRSMFFVPIIFITGYMDNDILMKADSYEGAILIVKPVEPDDIHQAVLKSLAMM